MTDLDSSAIRARCEAATEGPWVRWNTVGDLENNYAWTIARPYDERCTDTDCHPACGKTVLVTGAEGCENCYVSPQDAEFIAHARSDIPSLLDVNDRLLAEIERLNAVIAKVEALAVKWDAYSYVGPGYDTAVAYGDGREDAFASAADSVRDALDGNDA